MNRIILIGNGFDLAHGLPTSYGNFIDWYWGEWEKVLRGSTKQEEADALCCFRLAGDDRSFMDFFERLKPVFSNVSKFSFFEKLMNISTCLKSASPFLTNICKSVETKGWVDIENEYCGLLLSCSKSEIYGLNHRILNTQLEYLRNKLVEYLKTLSIDSVEFNPNIKKIIYGSIKPDDISVGARGELENHVRYWTTCDVQEYEDKMQYYKVNYKLYNERNDFDLNGSIYDWDYIYRNYPTFTLPDNIMLINFNYTATINKYVQANNPLFEINHIHGELNNPKSVIFGYGDDLDENYKKISNLNDNEYLTNFKSIKYLESDRYRKALQFMDAAPFQVYILGHSCGNSDRTFLNTLFEHKNCVSVKPYYYKNGEKDNYLYIVQNISRNFKDMKLMRDRVVNKTYCEPFSFR